MTGLEVAVGIVLVDHAHEIGRRDVEVGQLDAVWDDAHVGLAQVEGPLGGCNSSQAANR